MNDSASENYYYLDPLTSRGAAFQDDRLGAMTERHKVELAPPALVQTGAPLEEALTNKSVGVVVQMEIGVPGRIHMQTAQAFLQRGMRVFFHWPDEESVECIDAERLRGFKRLWQIKVGWWLLERFRSASQKLYLLLFRVPLRLLVVLPLGLFRALWQTGGAARQAAAALRTLFIETFRQEVRLRLEIPEEVRAANVEPIRITSEELHAEVDNTLIRAAPVPFPEGMAMPDPARPIPGCGVYLRFDFWSPLTSGGSYGHTCYVAKELARRAEDFLSVMGCRYALLDDLNLRQAVFDPPGSDGNEETIVQGTPHYYPWVRAALMAVKPAFIYERIVIGNWVGARLSQEFGIPYIVEYNGSEISMRRSFDTENPYIYEALYLKAEEAAFRQATLINVVSEVVKADLVGRGIDPEKILVNPNGVDPEAYAPAPVETKDAIRAELGFGADHRVIGMIGTFGGWHGIDVLAGSLAKICRQAPDARFLMIGDGNLKHLIDDQVREHGLEEAVVSVGRVPQTEGARLLAACDVLVSPHSTHMADSKFFGSPTKLFEYMAMGAAIAASDLEQIGLVLSPAFRHDAAPEEADGVTDQRAILCPPGDVEAFVTAVLTLVQRPELGQRLGANARAAVLEHYAWERHVERLWRFAGGERELSTLLPDLFAAAPKEVTEEVPETPVEAPEEAPGTPALERIKTGDAFKEQTQNQWNQDPCGSHYVKEAELHSLQWFEEAEAYRFGEYAPWMPELMEFSKHSGEKVLEIGGGMGTDLSQFARHGALTTDIDLSAGHLALAQKNFELRGLTGEFVHHDAESLPFDDDTFDVVYSNGVIHHTPDTPRVVREIYRVLKPGGKAIIMVYAENSLHYWGDLVKNYGLKRDLLAECSMGEIMSRHVEISEHGAKPLVKVYTPKRLDALFKDFERRKIYQRQMVAAEKPRPLFWVPLETLGRLMGWNLIIKAHKPRG